MPLFIVLGLALMGILVFPMLGTLVGAVCGGIVGLLFDDTFRHVLSVFNLDASSLRIWQLGAFLGFVGGFLKSNTSVKSS